MKPLNECSAPELENALQKFLIQANEAGKSWAKAKAYFDSLDDKKKVILASEADKFKDAKSMAEQEKKALASEGYEMFLYSLADAREKYLVSIVDWDMAKLRIDSLRSILSTRREEIKSFKG